MKAAAFVVLAASASTTTATATASATASATATATSLRPVISASRPRPTPALAPVSASTEQALKLRGGVHVSGAELALLANGLIFGLLGSFLVFGTDHILSLYGIGPSYAMDFLSTAMGGFQYLGALCLMVTLRVYASLTGVRDQRQTLEAFIYTNLAMMSIAIVRAYYGSGPSFKNVFLFGVMAAISYAGWSSTSALGGGDDSAEEGTQKAKKQLLQCATSLQRLAANIK